MNVSNVMLNVLNVQIVLIVINVLLPDNKLFQTVHVLKELLKSSLNVYLVIGIVIFVKTLKDIVQSVLLTELNNQPVSVQKELMKSKELQNVHIVMLSVKNVFKTQPTV
jgi:hypothetical protein